MAVHALKTTVKVAGTPVATVAEPTNFVSGVGAAQLYQVTNAAKRIWDPRIAVVVFDNGFPLTHTQYVFDYLFGKIQFTGYTPAVAITVSGSYLPMLAVSEGTSYDFTRSRELLDKTVFHATDLHRKRLAGLKSLSGSVKTLAPLNEDLDAGVGGTQSLDTMFEAGNPFLIEVRPGNTGDYHRAWVVASKEGQSADVAALVEGNFDYEGTALTGVGQLEGAAEGWGT